jgi:hypothetical protein
VMIYSCEQETDMQEPVGKIPTTGGKIRAEKKITLQRFSV